MFKNKVLWIWNYSLIYSVCSPPPLRYIQYLGMARLKYPRTNFIRVQTPNTRAEQEWSLCGTHSSQAAVLINWVHCKQGLYNFESSTEYNRVVKRNCFWEYRKNFFNTFHWYFTIHIYVHMRANSTIYLCFLWQNCRKRAVIFWIVHIRKKTSRGNVFKRAIEKTALHTNQFARASQFVFLLSHKLEQTLQILPSPIENRS